MQRRLPAIVLFVFISCSSLWGQKIVYHPVSREVIHDRLSHFGGKNAEREATIRQQFIDAGCESHLTAQAVKGSKQANIICSLSGRSPAAIMVTAHFDHVAGNKGVADNWSGASLLPSLYHSLKGVQREHTFLFVAFTAEEEGLVGSRYYAKHMTEEDVRNTIALVNIDTVGLSFTRFDANRADPKLVEHLRRSAGALSLQLQGVAVELVGMSDSEAFAKHKIPRITVHSITQETYPLLHTGWDEMSRIRMDDYYDTYRLVGLYLAYLDQKLDTPAQ